MSPWIESVANINFPEEMYTRAITVIEAVQLKDLEAFENAVRNLVFFIDYSATPADAVDKCKEILLEEIEGMKRYVKTGEEE